MAKDRGEELRENHGARRHLREHEVEQLGLRAICKLAPLAPPAVYRLLCVIEPGCKRRPTAPPFIVEQLLQKSMIEGSIVVHLDRNGTFLVANSATVDSTNNGL